MLNIVPLFLEIVDPTRFELCLQKLAEVACVMSVKCGWYNGVRHWQALVKTCLMIFPTVEFVMNHVNLTADIWECSPGAVQMDHPCFSGHVLLRRTQCFHHCCLAVNRKYWYRHWCYFCSDHDEHFADVAIFVVHAGCFLSGPERATSLTVWVWFTWSATHPYLLCCSMWGTFIFILNTYEHQITCRHENTGTMCRNTYIYSESPCSDRIISNFWLCCLAAGVNGSDLPVRGGRVPAHQLFQLQLLALCGSVCGRPHLPALHPARQTQACEGAAFITVQIPAEYNDMHTVQSVHVHTHTYITQSEIAVYISCDHENTDTHDICSHIHAHAHTMCAKKFWEAYSGQ